MADKSEFTFIEGLEDLEREAQEGTPSPNPSPTSLPRQEIKRARSVFQPREFTEETLASKAHVMSLKSAILAASDHLLDPITVWWSGKCWRCIDGHHRLAAYQQLADDKKRPIDVERLPVVVFKGSLNDAIREALRANVKDKLPMTLDDKRERAWILTAMQDANLSLPTIAKEAGVAVRTVSNMRAELKTIIAEHGQERGTRLALSSRWRDILKGRMGPRDIDEQWEEALAKEWAKRLSKALGKQPAKQPDVFLRALEIWAPHLLKRLSKDFHEIAEAEF